MTDATLRLQQLWLAKVEKEGTGTMLCDSVFTNVGTKELTDMLPLSIKGFDAQLATV